MTVTIETARVADFDLASVSQLFDDHFKEVALVGDAVEPDWERYKSAEAEEQLLALQARDHSGEGKVVGYSVNILGRHLHYDMIVCQNDLLFLHPDYRRTKIGMQLMAQTESWAKIRGAELMLWHCKPDTPMERLLRRTHQLQDMIFSRGLL